MVMANEYCSPRGLELRLLRCSFSPSTHDTSSPSSPPTTSTTKSHHHHQLVENLVGLIEKGDYVGALSEAAHIVFKFASAWDFVDSIVCADLFYLEAQQSVDSFLQRDDDDDNLDPSCSALVVMCIAIAAFLAFTQNNITGPCVDLPSYPFAFWTQKAIGHEWDIWARNQLVDGGSHLSGKFSLLQYIVYAKMLLTKIQDISLEEKVSSFVGIGSVSWWLSRVILLQQRSLDEHVSSLFDSLQVLKVETLNHFGEVASVDSYWGTLLHQNEALTIVSMAHLEAGIIDYHYGRVDHSTKHFDTAEEASGLQLYETGILGFRTRHQVDAKAQRVLVGNTVIPCVSELQTDVSDLDDDKLGSRSHEIYEASDILMTPKLLTNKNYTGMGTTGTQGVISSIPLAPIQQAVVLAQCLIIEKNNPHDAFHRWDLAPFIEAVDAQKSLYFVIQHFCNILRVRWEYTRIRTKERALLMMEKQVHIVIGSSPEALRRIPYSFGVYVPTIPELRKEYGELLVRCGMIGDALKIFEDLELWDSLIHCYSLLEKKAAAVELIKTRLCEMPNDPRLWCSLGDVTNDDSYYAKALEVSNNRSTRAKRSLARSAYNRGEYKASKNLWESALALNSLFPDGWFAYGAAALKDRDIEKALKGFTRAVQLDPDNGEAWNNIACLHMIKEKNEEAFIAFKEAVKLRRNSWQCWENYGKVAANVGNFGQALEATMMVLNMTNNKRVDSDLLERTMIEIESQVSKYSLSPATSGDQNCTTQNHLHNPLGDSVKESEYEYCNLPLPHQTKQLMEFLGKVLQQCVRNGLGEGIWGLYARWNKVKGDLTICSEALLKHVRSYQGADLWNNRDRFKKFASASLQLCEVYMDISLSTGSPRELSAAEMHLKNAVKQAVDFTEMEEFRALESCLEEVRRRKCAASLPLAGTT